MILCRVTGDVVSTVKNDKLRGHRLLICQPVELDARTPRAPSFLAVDALHQAGTSDLVLCIREGSGARLIFEDEKIPVEAVIVGIVDDLEVAPDEARLAGQSALERARAAGEVEGA
ncbi:MAG: EutN/CcmL family microcompartment protein [Planctomycetes bacterium]|nr:EutN/CcmL family microcompartment protein [Planctomycetota bacterium]